MDKIGVAIVGGTGVGAGELLRLLVHHPHVVVSSVASSSSQGEEVADHHPHLKGFYSIKMEPHLNIDALNGFKEKIVFSALPHGTSGKIVEELSTSHPELKIIDLSGDLRLKNISLHQKFYGSEIYKKARSESVYGLAELNRDKIKCARLVANPGCLATASILSVLPLTNANLISDIHIFAITGSSGAGKKLTDSVHHAFRHGNFSSYRALDHQHIPEIEESINASISFIPHRAPLSRGIFVTVSAALNKALSQEECIEAFDRYYQSSPFIRRYKETPEVINVVGSNFFDYSVKVDGKKIVICGALDNLIKGMAGAAIQNLNLITGLPETTGLFTPSLRLL